MKGRLSVDQISHASLRIRQGQATFGFDDPTAITVDIPQAMPGQWTKILTGVTTERDDLRAFYGVFLETQSGVLLRPGTPLLGYNREGRIGVLFTVTSRGVRKIARAEGPGWPRLLRDAAIKNMGKPFIVSGPRGLSAAEEEELVEFFELRCGEELRRVLRIPGGVLPAFPGAILDEQLGRTGVVQRTVQR